MLSKGETQRLGINIGCHFFIPLCPFKNDKIGFVTLMVQKPTLMRVDRPIAESSHCSGLISNC